MAKAAQTVISIAVEGIVDEAVARRLVSETSALPGRVYGKNGKAKLRERLSGYNRDAVRSPWVVLVDLDHDAECAAALRATWLPKPAKHMCFRIAVREVEAWLLADRERIAEFLGISASILPRSPEDVDDPKRLMIDLARRSRRRELREDMVPRRSSGRTEGPAYASRLIEFAGGPWRPAIAAKNCDSLRRCRRCLEKLASASVA
ncbi:MAG TPA: hypothetical protein VMV10_06085 [Pirellulales bacterium]|nr:hypothetical protein [Pirellulales bacterium]